MSNFVAEKDPSDSLCTKIEQLAPEIPYYTRKYRDALQMCGRDVWVLGSESDGQLVCGCLGEVNVGRLRKHLHVQSTPSKGDEGFWSGLSAFCRQQKITTLSLGTIGTNPKIPRISRLQSEKSRCEYWVDLQAPDFEMTLRPQQRRVLRKARKKGLEVRVPTTSAGLATHNLLTQESLRRRRDRGEDIPLFDESELPRALVESGVARIYECTFAGEVLGSVIITVSEKGVHGYSAGYSKNGMKLGAAVFLSVATFEAMRLETKDVFNLGDAPPDSGLAVFKRGLGARQHESRSRTFDTATLAVSILVKGYSSLTQIWNRFPGQDT